jgi:hypothetical protein
MCWNLGILAMCKLHLHFSTLLTELPFYHTLSDSNIHSAQLCLTNRPKRPAMNCMASISIANLSSLFGPNHTNHRFRIVKLELSMITPSSFVVTRSRCKRWSRCNAAATIALGGFCHSVTDASMSPVRALKRGRRCRGHGTRRKSCGAE